LKYFARKKYSPNTVKRWAAIVVDFIVFLERNGKTVDDVGDLLNSEGKVVSKEPFGAKDYLDTKTKYEASYVLYLHHVLKRFYTAWEKHFPIDNEDFPKVKKQPKRLIFTTEQVMKIAEEAKKMWIEAEEIDKNDMIGLRDYSMILINIETGARREQISKLDCEYFDSGKGTLVIPEAKGGRRTTRVLNEVLKNVLAYYMAKRKMFQIRETAMFLLADKETRVTPSAMSERFKEIRERAGVHMKGAGFHADRREKTLRLKKLKYSDERINDVLGWKEGSKMSHIYGALDQTEVQQQAAKDDDILSTMGKNNTPFNNTKKEKDEKDS
jgi:integrase